MLKRVETKTNTRDAIDGKHNDKNEIAQVHI